jgi:hypothetical protein
MTKRILRPALAAAFVTAVTIPLALWAAGGASTITYADGKCLAGSGPGGPWTPIKKGDTVKDGQYVKTEAGSKVEITLPDGSALRLGDNTLFQLEASKPKKDKGSSFSVLLGKTWAKVKSVSGQGNFEVKTKTAVAGVRGTVFSVLAQQDTATTVKVFEGEVAVNNKPSKERAGGVAEGDKKEAAAGAKKGERVQIAGPKEVSKKQWEEMIAKAMQMIKIAANGEMSEPLAFDLDVEKKDEWTAWNLDRDAQMKTQ